MANSSSLFDFFLFFLISFVVLEVLLPAISVVLSSVGVRLSLLMSKLSSSSLVMEVVLHVCNYKIVLMFGFMAIFTGSNNT